MAQQCLLKEMMQQMQHISTKVDQLSKDKGKCSVDSPLTTLKGSVNGHPHFEKMPHDNQLTIQPMKLDLPHFSGDDLVGSLYKAN